MSRYREIDLSKVRTYSIRERPSKVDMSLFASEPPSGISNFLACLPNILKGADLKELIQHSINAVLGKKAVIISLGGHVVKCGLNPLLISLMREGAASCFAVNGSVAIHDFELAMYGKTSEDVAIHLANGSFGMVEETNSIINQVIKDASEEELGFGEALGKYLLENAPLAQHSLFAMAYKYQIPVTVHVALGTDIIHQTAFADAKAIGDCSMRDFRIFADQVSQLNDGGIYLNLGSAVILPEVFLKALTIARNIKGEVQDFYTAVFDMNMHYRAQENVVKRPVQNGGKGYYFIGHHEIMIPLYVAALMDGIRA